MVGFQILDLTRRICGSGGALQQGPMTYVFPATDSKRFNYPGVIIITGSQALVGSPFS